MHLHWNHADSQTATPRADYTLTKELRISFKENQTLIFLKRNPKLYASHSHEVTAQIKTYTYPHYAVTATQLAQDP